MHKVLKAVNHNISWIPDPQTFELKIRNMELKNKMNELINQRTTNAKAKQNKQEISEEATDVTNAITSKLSKNYG